MGDSSTTAETNFEFVTWMLLGLMPATRRYKESSEVPSFHGAICSQGGKMGWGRGWGRGSSISCILEEEEIICSKFNTFS